MNSFKKKSQVDTIYLSSIVCQISTINPSKDQPLFITYSLSINLLSFIICLSYIIYWTVISLLYLLSIHHLSWVHQSITYYFSIIAYLHIIVESVTYYFFIVIYLHIILVAILDYQLDYIWNQLKPESGEQNCERILLNLKWEVQLLLRIF